MPGPPARPGQTSARPGPIVVAADRAQAPSRSTRRRSRRSTTAGARFRASARVGAVRLQDGRDRARRVSFAPVHTGLTVDGWTPGSWRSTGARHQPAPARPARSRLEPAAAGHRGEPSGPGPGGSGPRGSGVLHLRREAVTPDT
ncbi:hypothetical protein HBB16_02750 [Pseudonocardia sp. MCCB 268]|nr:hypothetical protein [Pseudonocardia cytotoxica]